MHDIGVCQSKEAPTMMEQAQSAASGARFAAGAITPHNFFTPFQGAYCPYVARHPTVECCPTGWARHGWVGWANRDGERGEVGEGAREIDRLINAI